MVVNAIRHGYYSFTKVCRSDASPSVAICPLTIAQILLHSHCNGEMAFHMLPRDCCGWKPLLALLTVEMQVIALSQEMRCFAGFAGACIPAYPYLGLRIASHATAKAGFGVWTF